MGAVHRDLRWTLSSFLAAAERPGDNAAKSNSGHQRHGGRFHAQNTRAKVNRLPIDSAGAMYE